MNMCDLGDTCGKHRVALLLKLEELLFQMGYWRRIGGRGDKPAVVAPNRLQRRFIISEPNQSWVTDTTYIRTQEDWLYLSVVIDLLSRHVIGMRMTKAPCIFLTFPACRWIGRNWGH